MLIEFIFSFFLFFGIFPLSRYRLTKIPRKKNRQIILRNVHEWKINDLNKLTELSFERTVARQWKSEISSKTLEQLMKVVFRMLRTQQASKRKNSHKTAIRAEQ